MDTVCWDEPFAIVIAIGASAGAESSLLSSTKSQANILAFMVGEL